jgi:uncharacterized membrane protein YdcZ (DUF606 family)
MKFITAIVTTAILAFAIGLFTVLPWYSFVFTSLITALAIHQKPWKAFVTGFLGVCIVWAGYAALQDMANQHILATKVAGILPLGGSYVLLILVTGVVGGLLSGFAALAGSYLRKQ